MQKLIKLNDQHYIIVDDSEIKEVKPYYGRYYYDFDNKVVNHFPSYLTDLHVCKLITHSTEPLEYKYGSQKQGFNMGTMSSDIKLVYDQIKPLSISEVEEAINGYSVEEFAWNNPILSRKDVYDLFHKVFKDRRLDGEFSLSASKQIYQFDTELREISKIKSHQELVKDKLFTVEDVLVAINLAKNHGMTGDEIIKSLLPKTEWDIEFDEQGKISLEM